MGSESGQELNPTGPSASDAIPREKRMLEGLRREVEIIRCIFYKDHSGCYVGREWRGGCVEAGRLIGRLLQ